MRAHAVVACALASTAAALPLACVDLFHSTDAVVTACQIAASPAGCIPDASAEVSSPIDAADAASLASPNFCDWTPAQARATAQWACAWLGACESPIGGNAFGACMIQALLAYDCVANPNHPAQGTARDLWACLSDVSSCDQVNRCVFPIGPPACDAASDTTACAPAADGASAGIGSSVRFECGGDAGAAARGENCTLWSKTCVLQDGSAVCGGDGTGLACNGGTSGACLGNPRTQVHWCGPSGEDIGIDCAGNGAQRCDGFPQSDATWIACVPQRAAGSDAGDTCPPTRDVVCSNGVASSCPAGIPERVDCSLLLNSVDACSPGSLDPPFDWTSPCQLPEALCPADGCDGSMLTGCSRGAIFTVNCSDQGLGPCQMVATELGTQQHAACSPP